MSRKDWEKNKRMIQIKDKVECAAMDPILLQVKAQAKAKAQVEAACGDDSCCGCCCCESSPPPYTSPSPIDIPIPTDEPSAGCSTGKHKTDGVCVWDIIPVPDTIKQACPKGYFANGDGTCLPVSNPATSISLPVLTCASGYNSDGNGNCVAPPDAPPSVLTEPTCPSGYKFDGDGVCVTIDIPNVCVSGYESDGQGGCEPVTLIVENDSPSVKSPCPSGYFSDGQGNCVPNVASEV
jgi:hypothetical protein